MKRLFGGVWLLLSLGGALAGSPALTPADFAEGFRVQAVGDGPVQVLGLPPAVYRGSRQEGLADLRVFGADGLEVPHAVLDAAERPAPRPLRVPFFRVGEAERPGRLRFELEGSAATTLELHGADGSGPRAALVLDLRAAPGAVTGLAFGWRARGAFALALGAETSRDLATWSPLGTVTLVRPGRGAARSHVPLPPTTAPYLRLSPLGEEPLPPLRAVTATVRPAGPAAPRRWLALSPAASHDRFTFTYSTGARLSVDRARLRLPEANTLVEFRLFSAAATAAPPDVLSGAPEGASWTRRSGGLAYWLEGAGAASETPAFRFSPTTDRYWQVRVAAEGGGLGGAAPRLELGYRPQTLAFLARGRGPYLVAYGNVSAPNAAFSERAFLSALPAGTVLASLPQSRAGAPFRLAGADARTPAPPPPWRRVALWSSLVVGVGGLGVLAFRLFRQLGPPAPP